jgi:hypothetical protein
MSIGDKHIPEIVDGVYCAGCLKLSHGYNKSPSSCATPISSSRQTEKGGPGRPCRLGMRIDRPLMLAASVLVRMPGWDESIGLGEEFDYFRIFVGPDVVQLSGKCTMRFPNGGLAVLKPGMAALSSGATRGRGLSATARS